MNCDKCGGSEDSQIGVGLWYHLTLPSGQITHFCSRRCLTEFIAPELTKAVVVKQWVPNEEEIRRMSGEES